MGLSKFSKGALASMVIFALLAVGLAAGNQFLLFSKLDQSISRIPAISPETSPEALKKIRYDISAMQTRQWTLFIPILGGAILLLALIFWALIKGSARKLTSAPQVAAGRPVVSKERKTQPEKRDPTVDQRLFLHLVSVLQREGRLVDFLFEDLSAYDDSQIGAAVRPIHENCNRIIRKALAPKPVMDLEEGEPVTVESGFDPTSIKLTGNVTGEPPFKGTLQHPGWRAAKLDLPTLSGSQNSQLIAPAEVELE